MSMAPLFMKYQSKTGHYYVYDTYTNEILRIDKAVYRILDDYRVLDMDELIQKHHAIGVETLHRAVSEIEEMRGRGILRSHSPQRTAPAERVSCEGKTESLQEFLQYHRRLLTLELTQRCNLECEYCCYGKHYPQTCRSSGECMSFETAKKAVKTFLDHGPKKCYITFYGGEPLLEFDLLRQIVLYGEDLAAQRGANIRFSVTTNGTLLTDEKIHFLVQHDIRTMISLDGDKESHDRYRVFRNHSQPGQNKGSFDVIVKNMKRFVELYPDFPSRGFTMTLTATSNFEGIQSFLSHWKPSFPVLSANFVRRVFDPQLATIARPLQIGCAPTLSCRDGFGEESRFMDKGEGGVRLEGFDVPTVFNEPEEVPEFDRWTQERSDRLQRNRNRFIDELSRTKDLDDLKALRNRFIVDSSLYYDHMRRIHNRPIFDRVRADRPVFRLACLPGATRTFCSAHGAILPCEKTDVGTFFELGDVISDLDASKACDMVETARLVCDCGNCVVNRLCSFCPAQLWEMQNISGKVDAFAFQRKCRGKANADFPEKIIEYTSLMEMNLPIIDDYLRADTKSNDWLNDVTILEPEQGDTELLIEELEEYV